MSERSGKRPRVDDDAGGFVASPDDQEVLKALADVEECQEGLDKVNEEASDKVMRIQQEYNKVREPLYAKRAALVRKIPEFWKTALQNHPTFREVITEDDESVLYYLTEVIVEDEADMKSGFNIVFRFGSNPFFKDRELKKTISFSEEGIVTVDSTSPQWLEGMGPNDEPLSGSNKRSRPNNYVFLQWFAEAGVIESGEQDEMAAIIHNEIWPNPLQYFQEEDEDEYDGSYPADGVVLEEEYGDADTGDQGDGPSHDNEEGNQEQEDSDDHNTGLSPSKPHPKPTKDG